MHTDNQNFNMDTTNTQPNQTTAIDQRITGGDPDVDALQAEFGGEEAVGGTAPTPDQDQVEEIAIAAGVPLADKQPVQIRTQIERRDAHRWELDPDSAEDEPLA